LFYSSVFQCCHISLAHNGLLAIMPWNKFEYEDNYLVSLDVTPCNWVKVHQWSQEMELLRSDRCSNLRSKFQRIYFPSMRFHVRFLFKFLASLSAELILVLSI
jgi:hypothetical protein